MKYTIIAAIQTTVTVHVSAGCTRVSKALLLSKVTVQFKVCAAICREYCKLTPLLDLPQLPLARHRKLNTQ